MGAYIGFLILILIEWMILFSKMKLKIGGLVEYNRRKKFIILVCIEMICFAGIRSFDLGADMENYLGSLRYYSALPHDQILKAKLVYPFDYEVGYFLLVKFCAWLGMSETVFLFVIAALIYIPVCWFVLQYSENPAIGVLVYFAFSGFAYSLGIFRQMIALSILLIGSKYIVERRLFRFIITVGIAILFHTTAIILIPFYWLYRMKLYNKIQIIVLAEFALLFISRALILLVSRIFPIYAGYVSSIYDVQGGSYLMLILLNLVLFAGCIVSKREENSGDENLCMSLNATILAIFLQIISYSMGIFGRIVPYYSIYLTILIPALVNKCFRKNTVLVHFLCVVVLIGIFWYLTQGTNIDPYRTIFAKW